MRRDYKECEVGSRNYKEREVARRDGEGVT